MRTKLCRCPCCAVGIIYFGEARLTVVVAGPRRGMERKSILVSALALIANPIVLMRFAFHLGNHFDFSKYASSHRYGITPRPCW
jgi:hypothetical protein